jgi:putative lumazine-binding protein
MRKAKEGVMSGARMAMAITGCALALAAAVGTAGVADADRAAVEAVVKTAYVDGVHAKGDPALMRQGFHPDFRMLTLRSGAMTPVTLEEWIARLEKGNGERTGPRPEIRHEFTHVDVTGNAAVVRLELYRDGKHTFTDYLSLYRFPDGWKIVSKTFHAHAS